MIALRGRRVHRGEGERIIRRVVETSLERLRVVRVVESREHTRRYRRVRHAL